MSSICSLILSVRRGFLVYGRRERALEKHRSDGAEVAAVLASSENSRWYNFQNARAQSSRMRAESNDYRDEYIEYMSSRMTIESNEYRVEYVSSRIRYHSTSIVSQYRSIIECPSTSPSAPPRVSTSPS